MATELTSDAPGDGAAATPKGSAPASTPEVDDGSTDSPAVVPVERFNGLMSTMNRKVTELEAQIETLSRPATEAPQPQAQVTGQEPYSQSDDPSYDAVVALQQQVAEMQLREDRRDVLAELDPEVGRLVGDLLMGDKEQMREVAATVSARLAASSPATADQPEGQEATAPAVADSTEKVDPAPPPTPPAGGGSVISVDQNPNDRVHEIALSAAAKGGGDADDWSAILAAIAERSEAKTLEVS